MSPAEAAADFPPIPAEVAERVAAFMAGTEDVAA